MAHLHPHRADSDEIFQRYLDRAIVDINALADEIRACRLCSGDLMGATSPVLGTGHPLADVFVLKYRPRSAERGEGVAFYGPAGEALLRSAGRLGVDPVDMYGTNCLKCSDGFDECAERNAPEWLRKEFGIVDPKLLIVMGEPALEFVDLLDIANAAPLAARTGALQPWTPTCDALYCPDIDECLSRPAAKREFWNAFRILESWYRDQPPY